MADYNSRLPEQQEEKIDIIHGIAKGWKVFRKTWWLLIFLIIVSVAGTFLYVRFFHTEKYEASASFSVSIDGEAASASTYSTLITLNQLGATFPYILESGALKNVVAEDLGLSTLPGVITATVIEDTNLFQISVVCEDAQMAADILDSVIANYPTVARYIIGNTTLTMLDNTGVPSTSVNAISKEYKLEIGIIIGFGIYFLFLIVLAAARKTVVNEEDLKRYTSVRCLACVPRTYMKRRSKGNQKLMLVNQHVTPAFVEAISSLRIRLLRQLKREKQQIVLLTSASESEGKTTIAVNLALSCALKGYRVLIIDGDLRHPSVGRMLGMEPDSGLAEILEGKKSMEEASVRYGNTHLHVLAGSKPVVNSKIAALLGSDGMQELIENCRKEYDYIFIDTPPCGLMQDAAMLSSVSDCSIMVIRQDFVARDRILSAMELLADTDARLIGYVINSEETGIGSYGYGRYGYGKYGYGKYGKYGKYGYGEKSDGKSGKDDGQTSAE